MTVAVMTDTRRLLADRSDDLDAHFRHSGPIPWEATRRLITTVDASGLTGRGGAGFPTARKMAAVARHDRQPVVVGNGAEGEPASAKDRELLQRVPHLVLDGLQLAADALGAQRGYLYVQEPALASVQRALAARSRWDHLPIEVVRAPDTFISGQESAVVAAIEGRPARPRDMFQRVVDSGVNGAPTLVQNVETLAHIAMIARRGPAWFRDVGTPDEPGTFLVTRSGAVRDPGVIEVPYGAPLGDVVGVTTEPVQALLIGGYHGAWVPPLPDLPMSRRGLAPFGAAPGAGVVIALPASACGIGYAARVVDYLAAQSARQCGPCLNGLPRLADLLGRLARAQLNQRNVGDIALLNDLVSGRGACQHPDGTARLVRSTLTMFATDVRAHLSGRCAAQPGGAR